MEQFSNEEILLMTQVLMGVLLDHEEAEDEDSKEYIEDCFSLLQKVIRNIE